MNPRYPAQEQAPQEAHRPHLLTTILRTGPGESIALLITCAPPYAIDGVRVHMR